MEKRELICIGCPMGCPLTVQLEDGEILSITGQTCKRGEVYARNEVTNPTRIGHCSNQECMSGTSAAGNLSGKEWNVCDRKNFAESSR